MVSNRGHGRPRRLLRLVVPLTAAAAVVLGATAPAAHADTAPPLTTPPTPPTVSADVLPMWQIDGVVWSQATVGNTVYAGGSFTQARPPGAKVGASTSVAAKNLFAYNITNGGRFGQFNHSTNGQVRTVAASPDGATLYIGGDFTQVDGVARSHVAAFSTATNALLPFAPAVNGSVTALAPTNSAVYLGGKFTKVGGANRTNLALLTEAGSLSASWTPTTDNPVFAMVYVGGQNEVVIGGQFYLLNGNPSYGMGAVDATLGNSVPWAINKTIQVTNKSGNTTYHNGAIASLRTDGQYVYGAAWSNGSGARFEGTFAADANGGAAYFINDCHGDSYDVLPVAGVLYVASHSHDCSQVGGFPATKSEYHATAFGMSPIGTYTAPDDYKWNFTGKSYTALLDWFPALQPGRYTTQRQAAWSVTGTSDGKYVVFGGEFPSVNGIPQQGLARFATSDIAPNKVGPLPTSVSPPSVSVSGADIHVTWREAWDRDNTTLTYSLVQIDSSGTRRIVKQFTRDSTFWTLQTLSYLDSSVSSTDSYRYQVKVNDPFGNVIYSGMSAPVALNGVNFAAVGPCRVFDTRVGKGNCTGAQAVPKAPLGAARTMTVKVAGVGGVPAAATAVVLNLTAVGATKATFVTAWPAGAARPVVSNLNVNNNKAVPNLAVVPIGAGGSISLYNNAGSVNLLGDVSGYYAPQAPATYTKAGPCRVFDTRVGKGNCSGAQPVQKAPLGTRKTLTVKVAGVAGVPSNAKAVVVNLTAVDATKATYVTAWPAGKARPGASNLNVNDSKAVPNLAIVPVGSNGSISLYNNAGSVDLIADISGYFAPQSGSTYTKAGPCRVFDTRTGAGICPGAAHVAKAKVGAGATLTVKVTGVAGVPSNATAVIVNLTAVDATTATYVTAWPAGKARPGASNLNVNSAAAVPNLAIVPVGSNGSISLYNNKGSVNLLADISGYLAP